MHILARRRDQALSRSTTPQLVRVSARRRARPALAVMLLALCAASVLTLGIHVQRAPPLGAWPPSPIVLLAPGAPPPTASPGSASALAPVLHVQRGPVLTGSRPPWPTTLLVVVGMHTKVTIVPDGDQGKDKHAVDEIHHNVPPQTCVDGIDDANIDPVAGIYSKDDGDATKSARHVRNNMLADGEKNEHTSGEVRSNGPMTRIDNNSVTEIPGNDDRYATKDADQVVRDGAGSNTTHIDGEVRGNKHSSKDGTGNGCKCRCECAKNLNAFKAYVEGNRDATLREVKQFLEEHKYVVVGNYLLYLVICTMIVT